MAKTLSPLSGRGSKVPERKPTAKLTSEKSKKLSKIGEWWLAHPNGLEGTYDMRAVMK